MTYQEPSSFRLQVAPLATLAARRVCLIKPSALGDVVQALPVVHALRRRFPSAHLTWVLGDSLVPLIDQKGIVDQVIPFHRNKYRLMDAVARRDMRALINTLRAGRFDLTIDLQGLFRSAALCWATRAPVRIGLVSAREGSRLSYTHLAHDGPSETNGVERYWSVVRMLGAGSLPKDFGLRLDDDELAWAMNCLKPYPRPWLAVHAGARWETKRYPASRFAEVTTTWAESTGGTVIALGAPEDIPLGEVLASAFHQKNALPSFLNLVGKTSLRHLAAVLSAVDRLLTNDTGPMHLAAAVGTPTTSIFTCTSPVRSGPWGENHRVCQTTVPCRALYLKNCSRLVCMDQIVPNDLLPLLSPDVDSTCSRAA